MTTTLKTRPAAQPPPTTRTYISMCRRNPEQWQTERWGGKQYETAPAAEMQAAIYACQACPLLKSCSDQATVETSIHAGVIYDAKATPYTSVTAFLRRKKEAPLLLCGNRIGTQNGYRDHLKGGEKPCARCRDGRNEAKRKAAKRKGKCTNGHPRTPQNTRIDKRNQRVCIECRPALAYLEPYVPCGSLVGAEAHFRRGEPICEECVRAVNEIGLRVAS